MPPMTGTVDDLDLSMLDPADPDERRLLIEADHPMLQQALRDGLGEITLDGQVMNPNLHITLHEIVAERLGRTTHRRRGRRRSACPSSGTTGTRSCTC